MQDLTEVTQDVHYENYRSDRLAKGSASTANGNMTTSTTAPANTNGTLGKNGNVGDDHMMVELQQKEAQIRKMQEMMAKMQAQLQDKK